MTDLGESTKIVPYAAIVMGWISMDVNAKRLRQEKMSELDELCRLLESTPRDHEKGVETDA